MSPVHSLWACVTVLLCPFDPQYQKWRYNQSAVIHSTCVTSWSSLQRCSFTCLFYLCLYYCKVGFWQLVLLNNNECMRLIYLWLYFFIHSLFLLVSVFSLFKLNMNMDVSFSEFKCFIWVKMASNMPKCFYHQTEVYQISEWVSCFWDEQRILCDVCTTGTTQQAMQWVCGQ